MVVSRTETGVTPKRQTGRVEGPSGTPSRGMDEGLCPGGVLSSPPSGPPGTQWSDRYYFHSFDSGYLPSLVLVTVPPRLDLGLAPGRLRVRGEGVRSGPTTVGASLLFSLESLPFSGTVLLRGKFWVRPVVPLLEKREGDRRRSSSRRV